MSDPVSLVFHILQLSVLAFSLLIIVHIGLRKDRQVYSNHLLTVFFGINILGLALYLMIATGLIEQLWFLYRTTMPFTIIGPAIAYLYIQSVLSDDRHLKRKDFWHALPFVLTFIQYAPYYFSSAARKKQMVAQLLEDKTVEYVMNVGLLDEYYFSIFRGIVYFFYALLILRLVYQFNLKGLVCSNANSKIQQRVYNWLLLFSISFVINLAAMTLYIGLNLMGLGFEHNLLGLLKLITIVFFNMSIIVYTVYLLLYPETLIGVYQPKKKKVENAGPISYLKSESEALKTILEKQKVFRQPGLKLSDLSNILNVSPRKLSFLINSQYNMNFNELINEYRINDALELIEEGYLEKYTAESLFEATGFQNKTSFYKAFKAKTGTTPSSYLKMVS